MQVSLTPELEDFVNRKMASGRYQRADDVIREALQVLLEQEELTRRREELRRDIVLGIEQAEQGLGNPLSEELIEEVKRRSRGRLQTL